MLRVEREKEKKETEMEMEKKMKEKDSVREEKDREGKKTLFRAIEKKRRRRQRRFVALEKELLGTIVPFPPFFFFSSNLCPCSHRDRVYIFSLLHGTSQKEIVQFRWREREIETIFRIG